MTGTKVGGAIELHDVAKRYRLVHESPTLVRSLFHAIQRRRIEYFWALEGVSFRCGAGETLGVIGRNGSGKTTLLRMLAGVTAPTLGRVRVEGRIAPLIGVGVGFNPELSGRENVFVNGRMLGLTLAEINERFDRIAEFSELGGFLDTAVKNYSSGMFLRLAFAIGIHVDPDVLLVDELLAVGDFAFQQKCMARMRELQEGGTTLVVVTHNIETVERMCQRVIVLHRGQAKFDGAPDAAIDAYHDILHEDRLSADGSDLLAEETAFPVIGGAEVRAEIVDQYGAPTRQLRTGDAWAVRALVTFDHPVTDPLFGLAVWQPGRGLVYVISTAPGDYRGDHGPGMPLDTTITLRNNLLPGSYVVRVAVLEPTGRATLGLSRGQEVVVGSSGREVGVADLQGEIRVGDTLVEISRRPHLESDTPP